MRNELVLAICSLAFLAAPAPTASAQAYGTNEEDWVLCSPFYEGSDTDGWGWEDTNNDGYPNSCYIQHEYGHRPPIGHPYCSPAYSGSNTDGYGWEDTNGDGSPNSCFIQIPQKLTHYGQELTLVGANLAWSESSWYARDVLPGQSINTSAIEDRFNQIGNNKGNLARIWLHTSGMYTPIFSSSGVVSGWGASPGANADAHSQLIEILDEAWERGVLVNFTLFSFDMLCDSNDVNDSHTEMLRDNPETYIDNVLVPMVQALKDHPALFSYEIFNESDGMTIGQDYFGPGTCAGTPIAKAVLQSFVNKAAAAIHLWDSNVKVTTSIGHPSKIFDYSNYALTSVPGADPTGTLDFYQFHWYENPLSPYTIRPTFYSLDKPVVVGEFDAASPPGLDVNSLAAAIVDQGYAGAWMWDFISGNHLTLRNNMYNADQPPLNTSAIESCITLQTPGCYNP